VDALDAYLKNIYRRPKLVQDETLGPKLDSLRGSQTLARLRLVSDAVGDPDPLNRSIAVLAISWRNTIVHSSARPILDDADRDQLERCAARIEAEHSGLRIRESLEAFSNAACPRFKEVASFSKSIADLVYSLDRALVCKLDVEQYAGDVLSDYYFKKQALLLKHWSRSADTREKTLRQILMMYGFGSTDANASGYPRSSNSLGAAYVRAISAISVAEATDRFVKRRIAMTEDSDGVE
jgi:hypothetical protein